MGKLGKHFIMRSVVLAAVLLYVTGCSRSSSVETQAPAAFKEPVYEWGTVSGRTISVWGRETDLNRGYIVRALKRYEEMTGNTVKTVAVLPEELEEKGAEALQNEDSGLDLLLYFGGTNLDAFDPDNNFYDFSDAPWVYDLTDVSINQAIYHGKVIGLPHWEASVSGTLYNKKIFQKLGIELPQTQEDFLRVCEMLKQNGVIPLYIPGASPTMLLYQFPLDTIVKKDDILRDLNQGRLNYADIPKMHTVVEWFCTMAVRGYLGEDYMRNDWNGMSDALSSGKYAMMLCWDTWLYTDFTGNAADFGLMPAFMGVPENGTFEGPNLSLFLVNKNGAQVDAALDLISFLSDPYNYNPAFEGVYTAPVFKKQMASISTPQYVEAARWIEENYNDSVAWLNIRGFSQSDASCILDCMSREDYTVEKCLKDMDTLRHGRMSLRP